MVVCCDKKEAKNKYKRAPPARRTAHRKGGAAALRGGWEPLLSGGAGTPLSRGARAAQPRETAKGVAKEKRREGARLGATHVCGGVEWPPPLARCSRCDTAACACERVGAVRVDQREKRGREERCGCRKSTRNPLLSCVCVLRGFLASEREKGEREGTCTLVARGVVRSSGGVCFVCVCVRGVSSESVKYRAARVVFFLKGRAASKSPRLWCCGCVCVRAPRRRRGAASRGRCPPCAAPLAAASLRRQ